MGLEFLKFKPEKTYSSESTIVLKEDGNYIIFRQVKTGVYEDIFEKSKRTLVKVKGENAYIYRNESGKKEKIDSRNVTSINNVLYGLEGSISQYTFSIEELKRLFVKLNEPRETSTYNGQDVFVLKLSNPYTRILSSEGKELDYILAVLKQSDGEYVCLDDESIQVLVQENTCSFMRNGNTIAKAEGTIQQLACDANLRRENIEYTISAIRRIIRRTVRRENKIIDY